MLAGGAWVSGWAIVALGAHRVLLIFAIAFHVVVVFIEEPHRAPRRAHDGDMR